MLGNYILRLLFSLAIIFHTIFKISKNLRNQDVNKIKNNNELFDTNMF